MKSRVFSILVLPMATCFFVGCASEPMGQGPALPPSPPGLVSRSVPTDQGIALPGDLWRLGWAGFKNPNGGYALERSVDLKQWVKVDFRAADQFVDVTEYIATITNDLPVSFWRIEAVP